MKSETASQIEAIKSLPPNDKVDAICDCFEQNWGGGDPSELAAYLDLCQPAQSSRLFIELLLVDWELRARRGEHPSWNWYLSRHPELSDAIEAAKFKYPQNQDTNTAANLPTSTAPLRRVGHFELLEKLGSGAAGEVWKAWDAQLSRPIAIKFPHAQRQSEPDLTRFLREARAAAQLKHPGIAAVHEVGRVGDIVYIASQYIDGQDLHLWREVAKPTHQTAAEICAQLAEALHHAHELGVVHRDLKPSNILIGKDGNPHVVDFGLAKWADDTGNMTLNGELLGTPAYMSPEQAKGRAAQADARTDVYSLGIVLYEMLTNVCPVQGTNACMIHQVINEEPLSPRKLDPKIPRDLETICLKAIEKDPARRHPSAQEMAVDLRRFLRGESIRTRRVSHLELAWRLIRRRPARAMSIVLALAVFVALGFATKLAREKHELLGLRTVSFSTDPTGARVVFVPIGEIDGEPQGEKAVHPPDRTPLRQELTPGDYLVVAALNDGRFHEVYRHVPKTNDSSGQTFMHHRWTKLPDGTIELASAKIPSKTVTQDMASLPSAATDDTDHAHLPPSVKSGLFMDRCEFSGGQYQQILGDVRTNDAIGVRAKPDWPVSVGYDEAVYLAEAAGKRLPTQAEFDYALRLIPKAVTANHLTDDWLEAGIGPVGQYKGDATATTPLVIGLRSNVAEWTTSHPATRIDLPSEYRVILGGDIARLHYESERLRGASDPWDGAWVSPGIVQPWLGFRCVRSAQPRFFD